MVKPVSSFVGGFVLAALVFGAGGVFVGYEIAQSGKPALLVRNVSDTAVTEVVVHSDREASRSIGSLSPRTSRRVQLSGADHSLWLTASNAAGNVLESEHVYVTSGFIVFGVISADAITLEAAL
jgi:hypothetical protein